MTDDYERTTTDKLEWKHVGRYVGVFPSYDQNHPTFVAGVLVGFDHHIHSTRAVETTLRIGVTGTQTIEVSAFNGPIEIARKLTPILENAAARNTEVPPPRV